MAGLDRRRWREWRKRPACAPAKSQPSRLRHFNSNCVVLVMGTVFMVASCDRMITPHNVQVVKDADSKVAQGDYLKAIDLYESALDGTPETADIHYKLGLLYDDKLSDPMNALHHFKRYIAVRPEGSHASEVKQFIKRDETNLLTSLSGDSL